LRVAVVGVGFVGEPLLEALHLKGHEVMGIETQSQRIDYLISKSTLRGVKFSRELSSTENIDAFILALPTPLDAGNVPDLSALIEVCTLIGSMLSENQIVIVESTYAVGTTRNLLLPLLGKRIGISRVKLAYSPERINPGDLLWNFGNTAKLVAAESEQTKSSLIELYGNVFSNLVFVDSFEIAEAAKLLENIYRFININFINEFQQNCEALGLDSSKVISAASTKPFGFQAFLPSLGIGGHCIPIAPHHFMESLRMHGVSNGFIDYGNEINQRHLFQVIEKIERDYLNLTGKRILVAGVTYKPGVPDTRESPAVVLINHLRERGVQVSWYDPLVSSLNGENRAPITTEADLALICVEQPDHVVAEISANFDMVLDISLGLDIRRLK